MSTQQALQPFAAVDRSADRFDALAGSYRSPQFEQRRLFAEQQRMEAVVDIVINERRCARAPTQAVGRLDKHDLHLGARRQQASQARAGNAAADDEDVTFDHAEIP